MIEIRLYGGKMTSQKDSTTLYERISKVVIEWTIEQNKKKQKPLQSTIVGTLDMVKSDWYAVQSINIIIQKRLTELIKKWKGKKLEIGHNGTITIVAIKEKK